MRDRLQPLLLPFLIGLALRVVAVLVFHGPFLFTDDRGYDSVSWQIAQMWRGGDALSPGELRGLTGSVSMGYWIYNAWVYYVFGHSWLIVKLFNALLSSLAVVFAGVAARRLGGEPAVRPAAWLVALYPTAILWGSVGLKDGLLGALLLGVVALVLHATTTRHMAALALLTAVGLLFRAPLGLAFGLMLGVVLWTGLLTRKNFAKGGRLPYAIAALVTIPLVFIVARPFISLTSSTLTSGIVSSPESGAEGENVLLDLTPTVGDAVVAALGPFPWAAGEPGTHTVYQWMYPGMVILILVFPAGLLGAVRVVRRGDARSRVVVVGVGLYVSLYLVAFTDGGFFRQRFAAELLLLILATVTWTATPRAAAVWTGLGLSVVSLAAILQSGALSLTLG